MIKMQNLYYDISPYMTIDGLQKNQVILFTIVNLTHQPILSFCYEDVMSNLDGLEQSEIYIPDIKINKCIEGNPCIFISIPNCEVLKFENLRFSNLIKSKFNNYNYIEKTIIDQVEQHENILDQLISQVKKLTNHLSGETNAQ